MRESSSGQVIFRTTSIVLKYATDLRRKATPKIQRILKLKNDPPSTNGHGSTPPAQATPPFKSFNPDAGMPHALDLMQQDINRIGAMGMQVVTNFETAMARVEQRMNDSIDGVRRDGISQRDGLRSLRSKVSEFKRDCQNNSSVLSRLDQQFQTTDRVVTELRQALATSRSDVDSLREQLSSTQQELQEAKGELDCLKGDVNDTKNEVQELKDEVDRLRSEIDEPKQAAREGLAMSKEYASEVSSLRREITQLRGEMAKDRAHPRTPSESSSFSSHELDILTSSISKIGKDASQIESVQMQVDLLRHCIRRLEAHIRLTLPATPNQERSTRSADVSPEQGDENVQPLAKGIKRQRRPSAGVDDTRSFGMPPKQIAPSPSCPGSRRSLPTKQRGARRSGATAGVNGTTK